MTVSEIDTVEQYEKAVGSSNLSVVHFYATWASECPPTNNVLKELAKIPEIQLSGTLFYAIDAEKVSDVSFRNNVDSAPTIILYKNAKQVDRIDGADAAQITAKVKARSLGSAEPLSVPSPAITLEERLKQLINRHSVMVFMKGDRNTPRCGFSRTLIQILSTTGIDYDTFDILTDEEVRQGLKEYSDWPTYPQVYVKGELVGGLDIIKEIQQSGELGTTLKG